MRLPLTALGSGAIVAALGVAGLVRGAMPQSVAGGSSTPPPAPIVVTGAYVRPPVPPNNTAAAYFTVYNTTGTADTLESVTSGAGAVSVLHTIGKDGQMHVTPNGLTIPAHGSVSLSTGTGHVMIEQLYGKLQTGQQVNLELDFANAGSLDVAAQVVPVGAPAPTGSAGPSSSPSPSGAHS
jgi:copper(I)-binding protein